MFDNIMDDFANYRKLLEKGDLTNQMVSNWSIRTHVEHVLITNLGITGLILDPANEKKRYSRTKLLGLILLYAGYIPRGQASAPEFTWPKGMDVSELRRLGDAVHDQLKKVEKLYDQDKLPKGKIGEHPYFGGLTAPRWIRMIEIHQQHHLKIIDDILNTKKTVSR